jgi:hypothetical protein
MIVRLEKLHDFILISIVMGFKKPQIQKNALFPLPS